MTSPENPPTPEDQPSPPLDSNEIQQVLLEALCLEVRALTMAHMSGAIWPTPREEVEAKISAAHLRADWLVRGSYSGQEAPGPPAGDSAGDRFAELERALHRLRGEVTGLTVREVTSLHHD